jgi:hypothetical protein
VFESALQKIEVGKINVSGNDLGVMSNGSRLIKKVLSLSLADKPQTVPFISQTFINCTKKKKSFNFCAKKKCLYFC